MYMCIVPSLFNLLLLCSCSVCGTVFMHFCCCCLESGRVFCWGRNSYGELGVTTEPSANSYWKPKEIECLNGVRKVC